MHAKVQKWGNSLAIRIPKPVTLEIGFSADREIEHTLAYGRTLLC